MVDRTARLSKNLTDLFGSTGTSACRVCENPLSNRRRKYCSDYCQRIAYAVLRLYDWQSVREAVLARDGHACVNPECATTAGDLPADQSLEIDYIQPLVDDGAAFDPANLQTLCPPCHYAKPTGTYDYRPRPLPDGGYTTSETEARLRAIPEAAEIPIPIPIPIPNPNPRPIPMSDSEITDADAETDPETNAGVNATDSIPLLDRISLRPLDELSPYDQNPKAHPEKQVEKIVESIREFGWDVPLVVDSDGEVIKGHGRLAAANRLDLDRVPVIERDDLSDAEQRAARLADNRAAESFWDESALQAELTDLDALVDSDPVDFDLGATGFDPDELDDFLSTADDGASPTDPTTADGTTTGPQGEPTPDDGGEFGTIDDGDMEFDHECPNCGYEW